MMWRAPAGTGGGAQLAAQITPAFTPNQILEKIPGPLLLQPFE